MAELKKFHYLRDFIAYNEDRLESNYLSYYHLIGAIERLNSGQAQLFGAFNIDGQHGATIIGLWTTGNILIYSEKWDDDMISELNKYIPFAQCTDEFQFGGQRDLVLQVLKSNGIDYYVLKDRLVYECLTVNPAVRANGKMELSSINDLEEISHMSFGYHVEEYDGKGGRDYDSMKIVAKHGIENLSLFVWKDGAICSIAQVIDRDSNTPMIGQLYTKKDKRSKGYATALLSELTSEILSEGAEKCGLMSDTANPASNKVFEKVGYVPVYKFIICIKGISQVI